MSQQLTETTCANCGNRVWRRKFEMERNEHHFCNKACFQVWRSKQHKKWVICHGCGKGFWAYEHLINNGGGRYHSKACFLTNKGKRSGDLPVVYANPATFAQKLEGG